MYVNINLLCFSYQKNFFPFDTSSQSFSTVQEVIPTKLFSLSCNAKPIFKSLKHIYLLELCSVHVDAFEIPPASAGAFVFPPSHNDILEFLPLLAAVLTFSPSVKAVFAFHHAHRTVFTFPHFVLHISYSPGEVVNSI
jgi:uncharacterized pyridoxamine 5'-phosphate oxidase family protein